MSTYDKRLDAVEKDITVMKRDIIYKLDDTNSAVGILQGVLGKHGRDIKFLINQAKAIDLHIDSVDLRLDNIDSRFEALEIHLATFEQSVNNRFEAVDKKLDSLDQKFDQLLRLLAPSTKTDE